MARAIQAAKTRLIERRLKSMLELVWLARKNWCWSEKFMEWIDGAGNN